MLKPAPPSLRELPRAPPGSLPPAPSGYGPPPTAAGGAFGGPRPALTPLGSLGGGLKPAPGAGLKPAIQHGAAHQTGLTPSLLQLFVPRPPLEYMPLPAKAKKTQPMTGAGLPPRAARVAWAQRTHALFVPARPRCWGGTFFS